MPLGGCEECNSIHRELVDLVELAHQDRPGPHADIQELVAWFDNRSENDRIRVRSALSKVMGRISEHQKLTGHQVRLPFSAGINPN